MDLDMAAPILVVDDDPKIVSLVKTYLEREGFRVITASNGQAALKAFGEFHPGLIVLDIMLPEHGDLVIDLDRIEVRREGKAVSLTPAEFRLLVALVEARGRVLTRQALLDSLYGPSQGDALERTVDVHIGRLRDKLGEEVGAPRYIVTVRGLGYRAVA